MLQFLPALILLLLQAQVCGNRNTVDPAKARFISARSCPRLCLTSKGSGREAQREMLVRLLVTNADDAEMRQQISELLQALDHSPLLQDTDCIARVECQTANAGTPRPDGGGGSQCSSSVQRFRDGPSLIA